MKTDLLSFYANPFIGLDDHENPYIHLTKFYELCGTPNDRSGSGNCVHEIASSFIDTKQKIASSFIHRLHFVKHGTSS
jgi:hypothetical protein